ncbi:YodL domain-containing protein [Fusibacter bizertensis]
MNDKNVDTFEIYQVKRGNEYRDYRFESYESLEAFNLKVELKNYDFIYKGGLPAGTDLEDIFVMFNEQRPDDFKGHSLSVSDVVVLNKNGQSSAHYVDSFGFKNVPEFLLDLDKVKGKEFSILKKLEENKKEVIKKDKSSQNKKVNDIDR